MCNKSCSSLTCTITKAVAAGSNKRPETNRGEKGKLEGPWIVSGVMEMTGLEGGKGEKKKGRSPHSGGLVSVCERL